MGPALVVDTPGYRPGWRRPRLSFSSAAIREAQRLQSGFIDPTSVLQTVFPLESAQGVAATFAELTVDAAFVVTPLG